MIMKSLISNIKYNTNKSRNDTLLHFSTHLQHDRHTCIYHKYGYPENTWDKPWANTLPLLQGSAIHEYLHATLKDSYSIYVAEDEVRPTKYDFKYGWVGTADAYVEDSDECLWLIDYKTISGPSFEYLDGPKPEHIMQVSAYYHFGNARPDKVGILYLPTSADYRRRWPEPEFMEITPIPLADLLHRMHSVEHAIDLYAGTSELPPIPEGKYVWKKNKKQDCWDLTFMPDYTTMFCAWKDQEDDPCGCSNLARDVVGSWSMLDGAGGNEEILVKYLNDCPGYKETL